MAAKAAAYVEGLAALDARSPEFAGKVGEITALGAGEMRTAAAQSNRMLERTIRSLPDKGGDAQSQVAGSLVELRRVVEDLDPRDLPASRDGSSCPGCPAATSCATTSPSTPPRRAR